MEKYIDNLVKIINKLEKNVKALEERIEKIEFGERERKREQEKRKHFIPIGSKYQPKYVDVHILHAHIKK